MNKPDWLQSGLLLHYPPQNLFFHAAYLGVDADGELHTGPAKTATVPVADCRPGLTNTLCWGRNLYRTPAGDVVIQPHEPGIPGAVVDLPVGMGKRRFTVQAATGADYAAAKLAAAFDGVVISEVAA
jgi:hypothetical protein